MQPTSRVHRGSRFGVFHRRGRRCVLSLTLLTMFCGGIYFALAGLTMRSMVIKTTVTRESMDSSDRLLRACRPLFRVMPSPVMQAYTRHCMDLTDVEAFFVVQVMRSDDPWGR